MKLAGDFAVKNHVLTASGRKGLGWPLFAALIHCAMIAQPGSATAAEAARDPTLIQRENAQPGATDWQLTRVRLDKIDGFRCPWIEGYRSKQNVKAGESIDIMVSPDPPGKFKTAQLRRAASRLPRRKAAAMAKGTSASASTTWARLPATAAFISCSRARARARRSSALARATRMSASA